MIRRLLSRTRTPTCIAALVLLSGVTFAASFTPSGTLIEAQASATFLDSANVPRETLSNLVITVVQTVVKVQVSGEPARAAVPGATVDLPFSVTNVGNDVDTVSVGVTKDGDLAPDLTLSIVEDRNCNGRVDAGESIVASLTLDRGERVCLVVRAAIAPTATGATTATLTLTATSTGATVEPGDDSAASTGTVRLLDTGIMTASLDATPSALVDQGAAIAVTLTASNVGAAAVCAVDVAVGASVRTGILAEIALDPDLTLAPTPSATAGAGTVVVLYGSGAGPTWSEAFDASASHLALFLEGDDCFFPQGAGAQIGFHLAVPDGTPPSAGPTAMTRYDTTAAVRYADAVGAAPTVVSTNELSHTVRAAHHVSIDGPANVDESGVVSGSTISLTRTVTNTGNADDRIEISVSEPPGSAWVCRLYRADGVTPLTGPIGPLAPGEGRAVITRCAIPADDASASVRVVGFGATSVTDPSASASITWTIQGVGDGLDVDVSLLGAPTAGSSYAPGATLSFMALVENAGSNPDNYQLSATLNAAGWAEAVRFHPAAYAAGSCTPITPRPSPVATTGIVEVGGSRCYEVVTTVPGNASYDWQGSVTVSATSSVDPNVSDAMTTATFGATRTTGFVLVPDRSATVTSPGIVTLTHVVRNEGNAPASVTLASALTPAGGDSVLYSWDGSTYRVATATSAPTLAAGEERTLYVRFVAGSGHPVGRRLTVVTTATADFGAGATTQRSVTNTYDVIDGILHLQLDVCTASTADFDDCAPTASGDAARPGQYLHYTLVATNLGAIPVAQLVVTEPLPPFTEFERLRVQRSYSNGSLQYRIDAGAWSATAPATLAAGSAVSVRVVDGGADVPIPPGQSVTVTLVVRVK